MSTAAFTLKLIAEDISAYVYDGDLKTKFPLLKKLNENLMLLGLGKVPAARLTDKLFTANIDSPPVGKFTLKDFSLASAKKLPIQGWYLSIN